MASGRTKIPSACALLVAAASIATLPCAEGRAQTPGVTAVVVKAANGCFASEVRFTGLVVPRTEAIVNLNVEGYEISEVLAAEGDMVSSGQTLAKLTRLTSGGPAAPPGAGPAAAQQQPAIAAAVPLPPPMGPEPLFRIIVGNKLEIEADVPAVQLPKLKAGELARVKLENGREVSSQVRLVLPEIDRNTQLGKVRLTVDSDPATRAGMFATGTIDASHSCGVSIPRAAVQYQTEGTTVQVVRDTTVETRRVSLGLFSDNTIEVLDGVKDGELVIANAGASLHDGDQVRPMSADEAGATGGQ
jgi:multidrug efflux pump subunit AcrA (membrane-fusion protein)